MGSHHHVSTIAIAGAGPSGLAFAKYLRSEKYFSRLDIFEQRSQVGGVWNYTPAFTDAAKKISIPQTNPDQPLEDPVWTPSPRDSSKKEALFDGNLYDTLETNIPHNLMQFASQSFPPDSQLFPPFEAVKDYLEEYANDVRDFITFETQVVDVSLADAALETWNVTTLDLRSGRTKTATYDGVVVANGHYNVAYVPDIKGIITWDHAYPGSLTHSKHYRNTTPFDGKKVIVVGNSASGVDIGIQIGKVASKLLSSARSESMMAPGPQAWREDVPEIVEFLDPATYNRAVRFADGRVEDGIDAVVFATGYFYNHPFLKSLDPPINGDGNRALNVYKHLFYIEHPTLVLAALNLKIIPFPLVENQAAVVARIWSDRLAAPTKDEMRKWEENEVKERGNGKMYHVLKFPADVDYINELWAWAQRAERREGLENDGQGRLGSVFGDKQKWMRERFPQIKKAFGSKGEGRHQVRTLEELGFDYEKWREEQRLASKTLL